MSVPNVSDDSCAEHATASAAAAAVATVTSETPACRAAAV